MFTQRLIFAVLVFIQFTGPSGNPIWIERSNIISVELPIGCVHSHARVLTGGGAFCVQESPKDIFRKLGAKHRRWRL